MVYSFSFKWLILLDSFSLTHSPCFVFPVSLLQSNSLRHCSKKVIIIEKIHNSFTYFQFLVAVTLFLRYFSTLCSLIMRTALGCYDLVKVLSTQVKKLQQLLKQYLFIAKLSLVCVLIYLFVIVVSTIITMCSLFL